MLLKRLADMTGLSINSQPSNYRDFYSLPQAGSWSAGGYWDADHLTLSGATVTAAPSREGASLLTVTGTPQLTQDAFGRNFVTCTTAQRLLETDAARWGQFDGVKKDFIAFVQFQTAAAPSGRLLGLSTADISQRPIDIFFASGTSLSITQTDGTTTPVYAKAVVASYGYTFVMVLSAGLVYVVDALGAHATTPTSAVAANLANITTFAVNAISNQAMGNSRYRRWGIKSPATKDALTEAVDLFRLLAGRP